VRSDESARFCLCSEGMEIMPSMALDVSPLSVSLEDTRSVRLLPRGKEQQSTLLLVHRRLQSMHALCRQPYHPAEIFGPWWVLSRAFGANSLLGDTTTTYCLRDYVAAQIVVQQLVSPKPSPQSRTLQ